MRLLVAIVFGLVAAAGLVILVLGLAGAGASAYHWPPLIVGVAGAALGVWLAVIGRDVRALPVLLATLIAFMAIAIASQHNTLAGAIILALFSLWAVVWMPAGTRSRSFSTAIAIARDPTSVFEFASDLRNWRRYIPGIESVEKLTGGPIGPGTRFDVSMRMGSVWFREIDEVVEYETPKEFSWRASDETGSATEALTFASDGGATTVTHRVRSEERYALALVGMGLVNPLLKWAGMRDRRRNLVRLKQVLESPEAT